MGRQTDRWTNDGWIDGRISRWVGGWMVGGRIRDYFYLAFRGSTAVWQSGGCDGQLSKTALGNPSSWWWHLCVVPSLCVLAVPADFLLTSRMQQSGRVLQKTVTSSSWTLPLRHTLVTGCHSGEASVVASGQQPARSREPQSHSPHRAECRQPPRAWGRRSFPTSSETRPSPLGTLAAACEGPRARPHLSGVGLLVPGTVGNKPVLFEAPEFCVALLPSFRSQYSG